MIYLTSSFRAWVSSVAAGYSLLGCPRGLKLAALFAAWVLILGASANAIPPALVRAIPADVVAVYLADGAPAKPDQSFSFLDLAPLLTSQAQAVGLLSKVGEGVRTWVEYLASAATVFRVPHAVALFDIRGRYRSDGGHELASLSAALVMLTHGDNVAIEQRVQHLLNAYTNSEETVLEASGKAEFTVSSIVDRRWPGWVKISWGRRGDYYIVAIGDGVFERVADAMAGKVTSLAGDAWFARAWANSLGDSSPSRDVQPARNPSREFLPARNPSRNFHPARNPSRGLQPARTPSAASLPDAPGCGSKHGPTRRRDDSSIALYIRFDRLEEGVDRTLRRKIKNVQAALGLGDASRSLCVHSVQGKSIELACRTAHAGGDTFNVIAGVPRAAGFNPHGRPAGPVGEGLAAESSGAGRSGLLLPYGIPEQAGGYALVHSTPSAVLDGICGAFVAARSPGAVAKERAFWGEFEKDAGVSIAADIVSHLDGPIAIHDFPRHPFRLPLAWTLVVPITGDAKVLRSNIEKAMTLMQSRTKPEPRASAREDHGVLTDLFSIQRDTDGLWYAQLGLLGPALAVTDRWLVLGYSPSAVRANLALLTPSRGLQPARTPEAEEAPSQSPPEPHP